jgi:hypothetical protein
LHEFFGRFYDSLREETIRVQELVSSANFMIEESKVVESLTQFSQVNQAFQHSLSEMLVDVCSNRISVASLLTDHETALEKASSEGLSEEIKTTRKLIEIYEEGIIPSGLPISE